jgi:hypothetical protein
MLGIMLRELAGELYRMVIVAEGVTLTVTRTLLDLQVEKLSRREDLKKQLFAIEPVLSDATATFTVRLPFIPHPNYAHRKMDWEALEKKSEEMSLLLWLFNYVEEQDHSPALWLSESPQLMAITTGYSKEPMFHNCPIGVGFHSAAVEVLREKGAEGMVVGPAEEQILKFYTGLSCHTIREKMKTEKNFREYGASYTGIRAAVRPGGTPHFLVPGNCACLGANPDEFKRDYSMHSHNMDSPLQQLSMLAGLVSFWNDFLTPAWAARKS